MTGLVAFSIVAGAQFFVTRDNKLLESAEKIYQDFGLNIIRPCDLIIHLDEHIREDEYRPVRLAGSLIHINLLDTGQKHFLIDTFYFKNKEKKADFKRKLYIFLAKPNIYETLLICNLEKQPLALIVYGRQQENILEIPLFRIVQGSLCGTLARHLILRSAQISSKENRLLTKVSDPFLSDVIILALSESWFIDNDNNWSKFNLSIIANIKDLAKRLLELDKIFSHERELLHKLSQTLTAAYSAKDTQALFNIEKSLWPAKIVDLDIPSFIVPIKPKWAIHLFDEGLANQTLFGSSPELSLNRENVYYRAKRPKVVCAPARILWYVSRDKRYPDSMHIRACSYLDECRIGTPKELFKRFRRLGIYEWKDVSQLVKNSDDSNIMALLFSYTELFKVPISWADLQRILIEETDKISQIQSPVRIHSNCFMRLYNHGQSKSGGLLC